MPRIAAVLVAAALLTTQSWAAPRDNASWQNVQALTAGTRVELSRKSGERVSGSLRSATADSVVLTAKQQEVSIPRAEVSRIVVKSKGRGKWIGLAIGAGAGAGTGAAIGTRLANESAGDINLKALSTAVVAAAGALIGLAVGATLDGKHSTVYIAP